MAEHKHGEMNIDVQEKTFDGFIKWVTYVAVACIALLLFIAAVNG
ncbi:MAG: aa3-type cytochrome c oxidase subunit IV [Roseovarius sp.]|nr:aa3-type cytochrome c oxidase subunit IV [Roseovarius sp.]MBC7180499.1 aa3-type cytochrome c oxidase subunit IV [Roseovarius sp.]MBQ0749920.1 aa3-type cytochrome c oxidase subunit IV [Roseovarius sp.]MBQ0811466.1 aa3-type cytochrome c oxidase subunit IV [Roseovarius sp.]